MSLHPVIRITTFLILVTTLARLHLPELLVFGVLFFVFAIPNIKLHLPVLLRFVWRLKWFWLSIILLYGLMPMQGESGFTGIHITGLIEGAVRCLSLLVVIMYFVLLIYPIPVNQLQHAWYWLMRPLKYVGVSPETLSLRISLTFYAVRDLQSHTRQSGQALSFRSLPEHLYQFIRVAIANSETAARSAEPQSMIIDSPVFVQWTIPLTLLVVLLSLIFWT